MMMSPFVLRINV